MFLISHFPIILDTYLSLSALLSFLLSNYRVHMHVKCMHVCVCVHVYVCVHACLHTCKCSCSPRMRLIPGWQERRGRPAHVQIFQLRFAMFSLASSALLEPSPEKLSIAHNSRLPLHPEAQSPFLPRGLPHRKMKKNNKMNITKSSLKCDADFLRGKEGNLATFYVDAQSVFVAVNDLLHHHLIQ